MIKRELDARGCEFRDAGLKVDLDPVCRSGEGSGYVSYIEATLRRDDDDVHDVVFFYIAREGRLLVDTEAMPQWIAKTLDESLSKMSEGDEPT